MSRSSAAAAIAGSALQRTVERRQGRIRIRIGVDVEEMGTDYVKPHGALNNMAHESDDVADAVARGIRAADRDLVFVANCLSEMTRAALRADLRVAHEAYADRRYCPDGRLMPRTHAGSVIRDPAMAADRVLAMLEGQCLLANDGTRLTTPIDTFCIHADEPTAVETSTRVREALGSAGIKVAQIADVAG